MDLCQVDHQIDVSFILCIQLDVIHVEEVTNGSSDLEFVSIISLCDYLAEGVNFMQNSSGGKTLK